MRGATADPNPESGFRRVVVSSTTAFAREGSNPSADIGNRIIVNCPRNIWICVKRDNLDRENPDRNSALNLFLLSQVGGLRDDFVGQLCGQGFDFKANTVGFLIYQR